MPRRHDGQVELRQLRYLLTVVDAGTVTSAAERLRIAQPAISRQLRNLERDLGLTLFDRAGARMRLNAAGRAFVPVARGLLDQAQQARATALNLASGTIGPITVAAPPATVTEIITPFIATLAPPDDPLILVRETVPVRAHTLLHSDVDMVFTTVPPVAPTAGRPLIRFPVRAHVSLDHPWAERTRIDLAELVTEPLVLLTHAHIARSVIDQAVADAGLSYGRVVECDVPHAVMALSAAGFGTGVVTDGPRPDTRPLLLTDPRAPDHHLTMVLYAAWDVRHYAAAALEALARRVARFSAGRDMAELVEPERH